MDCILNFIRTNVQRNLNKPLNTCSPGPQGATLHILPVGDNSNHPTGQAITCPLLIFHPCVTTVPAPFPRTPFQALCSHPWTPFPSSAPRHPIGAAAGHLLWEHWGPFSKSAPCRGGFHILHSVPVSSPRIQSFLGAEPKSCSPFP